MNYEDLKYWLWLSYLPMMWYGKAEKWLKVFGSPKEIFDATEELLEKTGIFLPEDIYNIEMVTGIGGQDEGRADCLKKNIDVSQIAVSKKDIIRVKEELDIPSNKVNVAEMA